QRKTEQGEVRTRAEHAVDGAREDAGSDLGMVEAYALDEVVQLDVDAEVVRVELQLVAGPNAAIFLDVHGHRGDGAVVRDAPVSVTRRLGPVVDEIGGRLRLRSENWFHGRAPQCHLKLNVRPTTLERCRRAIQRFRRRISKRSSCGATASTGACDTCWRKGWSAAPSAAAMRSCLPSRFSAR